MIYLLFTFANVKFLRVGNLILEVDWKERLGVTHDLLWKKCAFETG
jgi:hypothetical protein